MKHVHYDKIVAKAVNMSLVRFTNLDDNEGCEWVVQADVVQKSTQFSESSEYFLCLPQHKDACLHWLNGGDVQVSGDGVKWESYDLSPEHPKYPMTDFTGFEFQFRIKPKKEKRWMIYSERPLSVEIFSDESVCDTVFSSKLPTENKQKIEIEVEV